MKTVTIAGLVQVPVINGKLLGLCGSFLLSAYTLSAQITLVKECDLLNGASYLSVANNKLFFGASDPANGFEPWISDGTEAGTKMLKDIYAGPGDGLFKSNHFAQKHSHIVFNNEFYFIANDGTHGAEIWKSDGTSAGTIMLKDINPLGGILGQFSDNYPFFCIANGMLFFSADDNTHGAELWKTDGTIAGTQLVKDIYNDYIPSEPFGLTALNNEVFFRAWGEGTNRELWKSDGTEAGTMMVKDILPGIYGAFSNSSSSLDPHFCASGNYLYFRANTDPDNFEAHLWRTDGTAAGTIQLEEDLTSGYLDETEDDFADVNGTFYFIADNSTPSNLWKSDGTEAGTVNIPANNSLAAISSLYNFNGTLVFNGLDNSGSGLCRSDGTMQGTYLLQTFPGLGSAASVGEFADDGDFLFFRVLEAINASDMEKRVGQSAATPGTTVDFAHYGFLGGLTPFNDKIYFAGYDTTINSSFTKIGLYELLPLNVGIKEPAVDVNFSIYPNPVSDLAICSWQFAGQPAVAITLTDLAGKVMLQQKVLTGVNETEIDLHNTAAGVYLVKLSGESFHVTKKIIVSR